MSELVKLTLARSGAEERGSQVAVITIDNPPVNALSPGVPEGIAACIGEANANHDITAIVVIGAGSTFIAGPDMRELGKVASGTTNPADLPAIIRAIEDSPKPVVMALHG